MPGPALPPLSEWETFYVITGSSGAALTGLMFVVIALMRDRGPPEGAEGGVRAFATPNVVHFCAVLLLAAIMSVPHQTATGLALCVGAAGVGLPAGSHPGFGLGNPRGGPATFTQGRAPSAPGRGTQSGTGAAIPFPAAAA